jgi:1-acyl-sn-glycerol-3-phosphate acyltransferase
MFSRNVYLVSGVLGIAGGIALGSLVRGYWRAIYPRIDVAAGALLFGIGLCFIRLGMLVLDARIVGPQTELAIVLTLAVVACIVAWWLWLREGIEFLLEIMIWPMYRLKAHGPGKSSEHHQGPLIVIANHTAWLDPLWLAKFVDRSLTPMMTSKYYDVPILRWLMANVAHAIRVQAGTFRRDVPELGEAVKVLDRKGCLVIFPEGFMRRSDDRPLRNFGQGVWRILRERPATPVLICWIEGGWGSFTSYRGGLPMRNKPLDWRRPIDIAMGLPLVLEPGLLEDQRATRHFLMQKCLLARALLGLEPFELEMTADEETEKDTVASGE